MTASKNANRMFEVNHVDVTIRNIEYNKHEAMIRVSDLA